MQWTDRIRQVKILLVLAAIIIAVASLVVSQYLVRDLSEEERNKMGVWAEAMHALNQADENTDLGLVLKVIDENNTIPVVVAASQATLALLSCLIISSNIASDIWSHILSGWPSVTDSDVKNLLTI